MFLSLLSLIVPASLSGIVAYTAFDHFYSLTEVPFWCLLGASALLAIAFALPCKRVHRTLLGLSGALFVINLAYNFVFAVLCFLLSVFLGWLFVVPQYKERLLFTHDNALVRIRYAPKDRLKPYFAAASTFMLFLNLVLLVTSLAFSTPILLWGIRAFPVDLTEREAIAHEAVPSGIVTCASLFDSSAIVVDSFFYFDNSDGSLVSPAVAKGMEKGDVIVKINGVRAKQSDFIVKGPDGTEADFEVLRLNPSTKELETLHLKITPLYSEEYQKHVIGINFYDNVLPGLYQSIQTISFYHEGTPYFAATAHSSEIAPDDYVTVIKTAEGITRDEEGLVATAGETLGKIYASNRYGSFGKWSITEGDAVPIAKKRDLRLGKATLLSGLTGTVKEYEVYITGTYRIDYRNVICLLVTDEELINAGGITRGMSGSPIIQQGKIIGALSNTDSNGRYAFATFASDMSHELYIYSTNEEAVQ